MHVYRVGGHLELAPHARPRLARAVHVHLDAQSIRIGQIERLAHEVIPGPGPLADVGEVTHEPPQRRTIGQQDREVEQPEVRAPGRRSGAAVLSQRHQHALVAMRGECRLASRIGSHAQAEHIPVVADRPLQVGDLQAHRTQTGRLRQPRARGRHAVGARQRWLHALVLAEEIVGGHAHRAIVPFTAPVGDGRSVGRHTAVAYEARVTRKAAQWARSSGKNSAKSSVSA